MVVIKERWLPHVNLLVSGFSDTFRTETKLLPIPFVLKTVPTTIVIR